ncbi:MAG TPA: FtsX-like permease family protein [Syntrophomonadaceae bacterium]|nr:FtsX-like permease family protein [Syntrophomonadaceae bacterium]
MLGIIIGVAAVILMMSIGQGAQQQVMSRINRLGTNMLTIFPGAAGQFVRSGSVNTLTLDDVEAVHRLPGVQVAAPTVRSSQLVTCGNKTWTTSITGTTPEIVDISSLTLERGRFFGRSEVNGAATVAVIGQTVYTNLYTPGVNPVGTEIRIRGEAYRVIGLLQTVGASSGGSDQDDVVYIPVTTVQLRLLGTTDRSINMMQVQVAGQDQMESVQDAITSLLRKRHRLNDSQEDDFTIRNMAQLQSEAKNITGILTLFLAGVAAISLIVGGIGVMNIMLVSVTERTREIGVRMAIGASRQDILNQFLLEAVLLSLSGSFIGIIVGIAGSKIFSAFSGWSTVISFTSILIAVGFALLVGIFFGYYPARQAARLRPAEALSYE